MDKAAGSAFLSSACLWGAQLSLASSKWLEGFLWVSPDLLQGSGGLSSRPLSLIGTLAI